MKWAVLSDIHSNEVALRSVLDNIHSNHSVDSIICLGDIVGYGPRPKQCLQLVRDNCDYIIQGNHDRNISNGNLQSQNQLAEEGFRYSYNELSAEDLNWLSDLPEHSEIDNRFFLVHSHPEVRDEYVDTKDFPRMRPYMDNLDCMALGHTHIQHMATIDGRLIFNPGSVGQPRDKDSKSAYAIVTLTNDSFSVNMYRTEYNIDKVVSQVKSADLPKEVGDRLHYGR